MHNYVMGYNRGPLLQTFGILQEEISIVLEELGKPSQVKIFLH